MSSTDRMVSVSVNGSRYTAEVQAGAYTFIADEPVSLGGSGLGPDPYAYLLASLGGCMAITMRMYANRKDWSLSRVEVRLSHQGNHAEDCQSCEEEQAFIHLIAAQVFLEGNLDAAQRKRLFGIGQRCPLHKILSGGLRVEFSLDGE